MKFKLVSLFILVCIIDLSSCLNDNPGPVSDGLLFPQVRTIIQANCTISCHAPSKGFEDGRPVVLETDEDIVSLASSIKAAVADPIGPTNKRMPQGGSLTNPETELIVKWVAKGGKATD